MTLVEAILAELAQHDDRLPVRDVPPPAARLRRHGVELAVPAPATVDGQPVTVLAVLDRTAPVVRQDGTRHLVLLSQVTLTEPPRWRSHRGRDLAGLVAGERGRARALQRQRRR